jgi:predicted metal-dependent phosphoesterase TrpH
MADAARSRLRLIDPATLIDPASLRPPGGAIFDMHTHSSDRSFDSGARAEVLAEQAALRGLDGFVLTEHNSLWAQSDVHRLSEAFEVTVLRGMELGTDIGHVLVYGLDRYAPELLLITRLREIVRSEGAAMVLAHPMRAHNGRQPSWSDLPHWFEGIEAVNGDNSDSTDGYYMRLAADHGVATVGGSDAHSREAIGRAATAFPEPITELADLVQLLIDGRAEAVDMRPT